MLSKKQQDFKGLTEDQKIELKKMFNEYLTDYSKLMEHNEAVIILQLVCAKHKYAMHKCYQNMGIL